MIARGVTRSVTVEAPGFLDYHQQVLGQNELVREIIAEARARNTAA